MTVILITMVSHSIWLAVVSLLVIRTNIKHYRGGKITSWGSFYASSNYYVIKCYQNRSSCFSIVRKIEGEEYGEKKPFEERIYLNKFRG